MYNTIWEYRTAHGLTQYDLAALTGLSQGYISNLERGYRPTVEYPWALEAIADALGCDPDDLKPEPTPHALHH